MGGNVANTPVNPRLAGAKARSKRARDLRWLCAMRLGHPLLLLWVAACVWLLYSGLASPAPIDVKDIHAGMSFWMLLLSFPLGLLVFLGSNYATDPFGAYFSVAWRHHPTFFCLIWACYFFVGLVQWQLLLPWAMQKFWRTR